MVVCCLVVSVVPPRYGAQNTLGKDLVLLLVDHRIQLRFDPLSQRLKLVELTDFAKLELSYLGTTFR